MRSLKMSAPGEDTFPCEDGEAEDMEGSGSDEDEMDEEREDGAGETKVYVPGMQPLQPGEELEMDRSAYHMYHECQTGLLLHLWELWNVVLFSIQCHSVRASDSIACQREYLF